jgi:hypothetical protein
MSRFFINPTSLSISPPPQTIPNNDVDYLIQKTQEQTERYGKCQDAVIRLEKERDDIKTILSTEVQRLKEEKARLGAKVGELESEVRQVQKTLGDVIVVRRMMGRELGCWVN